jgi:NTE family protein
MSSLGVSSKLNPEWAFFTFLRDEGRRKADEFIAEHADDIGRRSTLDIENLLSD